MKVHLAKNHPEVWSDLKKEKEVVVKEKKENQESKRKRDETVKGKVKVFNLRTHADREAFFWMVS